MMTFVSFQGAFWGLLVGLLAGLLRFILEFVFPEPTCASGAPDLRPAVVKYVHYLYFAILLFVLTSLVTIIVSLITKPVDLKHVRPRPNVFTLL